MYSAQTRHSPATRRINIPSGTSGSNRNTRMSTSQTGIKTPFSEKSRAPTMAATDHHNQA